MRRPDPLPPKPQPPVEAPIVAPEPKRRGWGRSGRGRENEAVDPHAQTAVDIDSSDDLLEPERNAQPADPDSLTTAVISPLRAPHRGESTDRIDERSVDRDTAPSTDSVGWKDVWRSARAKRKVLRSEVRRFTARSRRRRLTWFVSIAAFLALIAGSFAFAYSPLFAVKNIVVTGTHAIDSAAVQEALKGQIGTPLAAVSDREIKTALSKFPFVETYSVQARPPHELVVAIVERKPVGAIATDAGFTLVDSAGVVLSTTQERPAGAALIEVPSGVGSPAFRSAALVMLSLPESVRPSVTNVTATTASDVTLTLAPAGSRVVWGSAERSVYKAQVLQAALVKHPLGSVSVYDVSSPEAIVMH